MAPLHFSPLTSSPTAHLNTFSRRSLYGDDATTAAVVIPIVFIFVFIALVMCIAGAKNDQNRSHTAQGTELTARHLQSGQRVLVRRPGAAGDAATVGAAYGPRAGTEAEAVDLVNRANRVEGANGDALRNDVPTGRRDPVAEREEDRALARATQADASMQVDHAAVARDYEARMLRQTGELQLRDRALAPPAYDSDAAGIMLARGRETGVPEVNVGAPPKYEADGRPSKVMRWLRWGV